MLRHAMLFTALLAVNLVGCAEPGDGATSPANTVPDTFATSDITADGGMSDVTAPNPDGQTRPGDAGASPDRPAPPPDTASPPDVPAVPDTGPPAPTGPVDPSCIDGKYTETLPNANADISGILASYSSSNEKQFAYDLLDARWPTGRFVLEGGVQQGGVNGTSEDCFDFFRKSFPAGQSGLFSSLATLVHECGHGFDSANFGFGTSTYEITSTLTLECSSGGGPPPWGDGSTPPRSEITQDKWEGLYPACASFGEQGCNSYGYVYLVGNGSQQGFNTVLEETLQYVNSLGTDYAFVDQANPFGAGSARDGILTFLWFVQRYLYMARTKYPGGYQVITNSCWREAILTIWGRAWLYIDETEGISQLGINDDFIMDLVLDPELLEEIERLRDAGPCN